MTIIARFAWNGCPVLMGDVLLSTDAGFSQHDLYSPLRGNIGEDRVQSFTARGAVESRFVKLEHKVCLVSPDLAFAWSGNYAAASDLAHSLTGLVARGALSTQTVRQAIDRTAGDPLTVLAVVRGERAYDLVSQCVRPFKMVTLPPVGEVVVAGSGQLFGAPALAAAFEPLLTGAAPEAAAVAVNACDSLAALDLFTHVPKEERFGGLFDGVCPSATGAELSYLPDRVAMFTIAAKTERGWALFPRKIVQTMRLADGTQVVLVGEFGSDMTVAWTACAVGHPLSVVPSAEETRLAVARMPLSLGVSSFHVSLYEKPHFHSFGYSENVPATTPDEQRQISIVRDENLGLRTRLSPAMMTQVYARSRDLLRLGDAGLG
jgi:hypothetical protein